MDPSPKRSRHTRSPYRGLVAALLLSACARDPVTAPARDGQAARDQAGAPPVERDRGAAASDGPAPADLLVGPDGDLGPACLRRSGPRTMFDSLTADWQAPVGRSAPVEATIKLADACSFHLVIGERSPRVHCYVPGLKLPFAHGQKVRVSRCGDSGGLNEHEYLVIRDLQGRLLLAGGGGSRMLDVPCVPPELKATRVDGACGVYDPEPDASFHCHGNRNFGVRLQADTSLTLWPREQGELAVNGRRYRAFALHSHDVIWPDAGARCTDVMPYYVGYVVVAL